MFNILTALTFAAAFHVGDTGALDHRLKQLKSIDADARAQAARQLGDMLMGSPTPKEKESLFAGLVEALKDEDATVWGEVVGAAREVSVLKPRPLCLALSNSSTTRNLASAGGAPGPSRGSVRTASWWSLPWPRRWGTIWATCVWKRLTH